MNDLKVEDAFRNWLVLREEERKLVKKLKETREKIKGIETNYPQCGNIKGMIKKSLPIPDRGAPEFPGEVKEKKEEKKKKESKVKKPEPQGVKRKLQNILNKSEKRKSISEMMEANVPGSSADLSK